MKIYFDLDCITAREISNFLYLIRDEVTLLASRSDTEEKVVLEIIGAVDHTCEHGHGSVFLNIRELKEENHQCD